MSSREFLEPCKAIAQLQIVRDLRSDSAVQISSFLSKLPKDIIESCEKPIEDLDEATIRDFSIRIPSQLLDLDLEEQIQNLKTFRDVVIRQQAARKQLIQLLLKSRCKFGSEEAAEKFVDLKETSQKLKRKQQLLSDALELEGLDTEIETKDFESELKDLPELKWYTQEKEGAEGSDTKKARVD